MDESYQVHMKKTFLYYFGIIIIMSGHFVCVECQDRVLRLGMLSPRKHPRLGWENNAAAATIAIEKAQSEGILTNYSIRVIWRNDNCAAVDGVGNTVLLRDEDDVDVFIGPPCSSSTKSSGLLAAFWNMPMFSQASTDPVLADKNMYKTLVRLGPPFNKLGKAFVEIFRHFGWSRVVMVSRRKTDERRVFCDYSSRSAEKQFRMANITLADWMQISDGLSLGTIDDILTRIQQRGRIVILCSENTVDRRNILLRAFERGMTNGEYVFFVPDHLPPSNVKTPWIQTDDSRNSDARKAFTSVFQITVAEMAGPIVENFRDLIPVKMAAEPWNYSAALETNNRGSLYSPFLHDAVYLYLLVLNETMTEGKDRRNGSLLFEKAIGKTFEGITGTVKVDSNGDRDPDYWLWDLDPTENEFQVCIEVKMTSSFVEKMQFLKPILWGTINNKIPLDVPPCGFLNELCPPDNSTGLVRTTVLVVVFFFVVFGAVIGFLYYRRFTFEKELALMRWKVDYGDIIFSDGKIVQGRSWISLSSYISKDGTYGTDNDSSTSRSLRALDNQVFSTIAVHKGTVVCVKSIQKKLSSFSRSEQMGLKAMRDLTHGNVNSFIGICLDERYPCVLTGYCTKGSIQDIVENDDIKLDWTFKSSLIQDIVNGIQYIHESPLKIHGNLKSSNCVVDNRWVAKVTDFGICHLRVPQDAIQYEICKGLLWTAPEILRMTHPRGSKAGDIYSLGIIVYEIIRRTYPYDTEKISPIEIVQLLTKGSDEPTERLRPNVVGWKDKDPVLTEILTVMTACWDESPASRPNIYDVKDTLKKTNKGNKKGIVDNMLSMLEKYANNLEEIVQERTKQLVDEKKKTDMLLYRMLPPAVAERLKVGQTVEPELYDSVSIFFSDIVGFTSLCSESAPMEVVDLLNDLYTCFDSTLALHDVYKVETIGDAYMVVSGVPLRNENRHVAEIANMALDLLSVTTTFHIRHRPGRQLQMRAGIHTGPCAAGVVGLTMPRYCLFGDTVNTASRMESNGEAMKVHVSQDSNDALLLVGGYILAKRGSVNMKGKGEQITYWLLRKEGHVKPLPTPCLDSYLLT